MAAHDANGKSNSSSKPPGDLDLFDQIQDEFDALLSGTELPEPQDIDTDEQNTLTDLVLQDTNEFLSTTDMRAFDMPPGQSSDVPETPKETDISDADIPLAPENIASDDTSGETPANEHDNSDVDILDSIDADTNPSEDEAGPDETNTSDLPAIEPEPANKIFLSESNLSDTDPAEQAANWPPASDLDGIDPFSDDMDDDALQEKAPVHPDMSEEQATQRQSGGRIMMFAGIFVVIVAGGIFWLTSGTQEPAEQLASGQNQSVSDAGDQQPVSSASPSAAHSTTLTEKQPTPENMQTAAATLNKKVAPASGKAIAAQPAETEKAAIQRAAVEKAKAKRLTAKQAAEKRAAAEKDKAERLAAKQVTEKRAAAEKSAVKEVAVIQPSTRLQKLPLKSQTSAAVVDESGDWVIELASVNSDKSARQHMARIRSMGVESKSVKVNDKGRIFHSIRITGFTSKLEAMKRRDALAKLLGVRGAKVEKL